MRVSLREHIEAQRAAEKERTNILFGMAWGLAAWVYLELGRRQKIGETREESRRKWVDTELNHLNEGEIGHRERTVGVQSVGRLIIGAATVAAALVGVIVLFASHTI
jgi:hypothetical protein